MRCLSFRENVLFMVNFRFNYPELHRTLYDVYTRFFFYVGVSALTILITVKHC